MNYTVLNNRLLIEVKVLAKVVNNESEYERERKLNLGLIKEDDLNDEDDFKFIPFSFFVDTLINWSENDDGKTTIGLINGVTFIANISYTEFNDFIKTIYKK